MRNRRFTMSHHTKDETNAVEPAPPTSPTPTPAPESDPALGDRPTDAHAGRPDQGITANTGPGAGGATEWGGGNKEHPSRVVGKPGAGQR